VASEQALAWSGLPVVIIRPTVSLESLSLPPHRSERSEPRPYQTAAMPARSSAPLFSAPLLIAVGRETRDHGGKLPEHLRPTELGTPKRLPPPRLGDGEA